MTRIFLDTTRHYFRAIWTAIWTASTQFGRQKHQCGGKNKFLVKCEI